MDVPDSVPSITRLIKTDEDFGNFCHWPSKKGTCGNRILQADIRERDSLIRQCRSLIRSERGPSAISDIETKLTQISKWILCKGFHRGPNSAKISTKWSNELVNLLEIREVPAAESVREILGIKDDENYLCKGENRDGTRCTHRISDENRECIDTIIEAIGYARDALSITRDNILVLAQLLMCQELHQRQAARKSDLWLAMIRDLFSAVPVNEKQPSTPEGRGSFKVNSVTNQSTTSSTSSRTYSIAYSTPSTSPPSQQRGSRLKTSPATSIDSKSAKSTSTASSNQKPQATLPRNTRSTNYETKEQSVLDFEPFPLKSNQWVLNNLYETMIKPISPVQETDGYVYAFKRPGAALIKVGYTNNIQRRMKEWRDKCKQDIIELYSIYVPHANKVESLIHATLYQERRRENLIDGRCNGGRGCSTRHKEWLDVAEKRVRDVFDVYKSWMNSQPYQNKKLTPDWVTHINKLRKTQNTNLTDPWRAWLQMSVDVDTVIKAKKEPVGVEIKVSSDVKVEEKPSVTTLGIKVEEDANATVNLQKLKELSRDFLENLSKIKVEVPTREQAFTECSADKGHFSDPFVTPAPYVAPVGG